MIITISGQYGSGGDEVGTRLAEILGYKIFESQLVLRAREIYTAAYGGTEKPALQHGSHNTVFHDEDNPPRPGTAYEHAEFKLKADLIYLDAEFEDLGPETDSIRQAVLDAQTKAVFEYAAGGNCVLFGKGSDYILRQRQDAIHIFSKADIEVRVKRVMNLYNLTMGKKRGGWMQPAYAVQEAEQFVNMGRGAARELIYTTDRRRAAYYEFISGEKWGDPKKFDYIISGNDPDMEKQTDLLLQFVRDKEKTM